MPVNAKWRTFHSLAPAIALQRLYSLASQPQKNKARSMVPKTVTDRMIYSRSHQLAGFKLVQRLLKICLEYHHATCRD